MVERVKLGNTGLRVSRIGLGGYPFGGVNRARGWDPFTPDGRAAAIRTVHAALDAGINYIDTAPSYGEGNSESIIGEAIRGRRDQVILATKVGYARLTAGQVCQSVEASLKRLGVEYVDLIQFHGGAYSSDDVQHIVRDGLLEMLEQLRDHGKVRFVGFTVEEPWTARPLIASFQFDVMQVRYNLIHQGAAMHALEDARKAQMGVAVMRPMTAGILQRIATCIAPQWSEQEIYEAALKFVLSDSRVHVVNVGMRWPEEVERNVALVNSFQPAFDMASLPRLTAEIYRTDDQMKRP